MIVALAAGATALKLLLAWFTYGTVDMMTWSEAAKLIRAHGSFEIYGLASVYNHPPPVSWLIAALHRFSERSGLPFGFLFRLFPIAADLASLYFTVRLARLYRVPTPAFVLACCALNPVNVLISGFHGNTDPIFVALLLGCVYFYERDRPGLAGIFYGLSLYVKIVPLLLLPALALFVARKKRMRAFFLPAALLPAVVFAPYLAHDFEHLARNVFLYSSVKGVWGMGLLAHLANHETLFSLAVRRGAYRFYAAHIAAGFAVYFSAAIAFAALFRRARWNLAEAIFFSFALFLVVTPGFGVQYLSWVSFLFPLAFPVLGAAFLALSTVFLVRVYLWWGAGPSPHFANAGEIAPWQGFDAALSLAVWALLFAAVALSVAKNRARA